MVVFLAATDYGVGMQRATVNRSVGRNIRVYRQRLGITPEELADRVGISPAQMARIELGVTGSPLTRLHLIAKVLGVDMRDLFPTQSDDSDRLQTALRDTGLTDSDVRRVMSFMKMLRQSQSAEDETAEK